MGHPGRAVEEQGAGQYPQRIEGFVGQRHLTHEPHQQHASGHPDQRPDRQLEQEPAGDATGRPEAERLVGGEQVGHERDPDRVVDAGLAFQDGPATPGDLPAAQHREHHRRVGGGQRRTDQQRRPPLQAEQHMGQHGQRGGGDKGAGHADPEDRPAASRNRRQPICIPPSNKMTASPMVTTRWTVVIDTSPSVGTTSEATAAATRKRAGAGIRVRSLIRLDTTAATSAAAVSSVMSAKCSTSLIDRAAAYFARLSASANTEVGQQLGGVVGLPRLVRAALAVRPPAVMHATPPNPGSTPA
jgi:hypothetical protein